MLGLIRDCLMFSQFGRGMESGAFFLAWTVPNLFRRLFGEGALSAAFVPVLTGRLEADGIAGARRSLQAVFGALLGLLVLLVALGLAVVFLLPESWLAGGSEDADYGPLLRSLLLVLLPYLIPICLLALAAAAQNVSGRFALPAFAPVLLNCFWIGALLWLAGRELDAGDKAIRLAVCLLLGGLCQLLVQLPGIRRSGLLGRPRWELQSPDLRKVAAGMAPMMLGLSVVQLNVLATQLIAAFVISADGANSVMFLAHRLLEFPHALLGIALGTAVFPLFSLLGVRGDVNELRATLDRALSSGLFLAIPAAGGLMVLAPGLFEVLFVRGRFTPADGAETALVLRVISVSLPALVGVQILARAHYASGDTRTPVRIALVSFLAALPLGVYLALRLGTLGLAISSTASMLGNASLLLFSMRRRLPGSKGGVWHTAGRALLATLPTCAVAHVLLVELGQVWGQSSLALRLFFMLLVPLLGGAVTFLVAAWVLGAREMKELWGVAVRRGRADSA